MIRVFFDVDGTLISVDDDIRPGAVEVFKFCQENNIDIVVWSGGGEHYARSWADTIVGNNNIKITVLEKNPFSVVEKGDIVIDDSLFFIGTVNKLGATGYKIPFFDFVINKDDEELFKFKDFLIEQSTRSSAG